MYISTNVPTPLQWPKDDDNDDEICKNKSPERKNHSYKITTLVFAKQKNSDSQNWTAAKNLVQHGMLKAKTAQKETHYSLLLILYIQIP